MAKIKSQADQRTHRRFHDQHGRIWEATVEKETGHPASTMFPRFQAPWRPSEAYFRYNTSEDDPYLIKLDYDAEIEHLRQAHERYEREKRIQGEALHKDAFDPNNPSRMLLDKIGPPPASPIPAIMAKREDPWILGKSDERPAWADKIFVKKVQQADRLLEEFMASVDTPKPKRPKDLTTGKFVPAEV